MNPIPFADGPIMLGICGRCGEQNGSVGVLCDDFTKEDFLENLVGSGEHQGSVCIRCNADLREVGASVRVIDRPDDLGKQHIGSIHP